MTTLEGRGALSTWSKRWLIGGLGAVLAFGLTSTAPAARAADTHPGGGGWAHAGAHTATPSLQAQTASPTATPTGYSVSGIDISSHDHDVYSTIDWAGLASSGVKFAYIKATESQYYTNPWFDGSSGTDYKDAKAAGLLVGAYTYATPDSVDPVGDADYFIDHADWTTDAQTLVPMIDLEWPYWNEDTCYGLTTAQMNSWIQSFVDEVYKRIGHKPMIYTAASWWNQCTGNTTQFGGYPLNIAYWSSTAPTTMPSGWTNWSVWQYAEGNNSQQGNYDKDVYSGDLDGMRRELGAQRPIANLTVTPSAGGSTGSWPVTADASKSVAQGAAIASYTFDFGDGTTLTQADAVAQHPYAATGRHKVTVTVTDANGYTEQTSQWVGVGEMYVPDGPVRVLDTRSAVGVGTTTPVASFGTVTLPVAGGNGVPSTGVSAVVLNVTVTAPSASGVLTVYPDGSTRPNASSLNWTAGQTIANLVTVPVINGKVDFYNASSGTVHIVADLMGYYANVDGALFTGVSPQRYLDTRANGGAPVSGGGTVTISAPAGATAAVFNVTVTAGTKSGFLTVYPDGQDRPNASNLNWTAGQTIANLVTVPVVDGKVSFYNGSSGTVHVIADLFGYYVDQYTTGSPYAPFGPTRLLDTRTSGTGAPVAPGGTVSLPIAGTHGLPSNVSAVVLNVTVTGGTTAGFLTAYPHGQTRPTASNLNWTAGQTIANAVIVPVGTGGAVDFYNAAGGSVHLIVDIVGYFAS